ncbi:MAG: thioredoxin [Gemmataceae bacterium]
MTPGIASNLTPVRMVPDFSIGRRASLAQFPEVAVLLHQFKWKKEVIESAEPVLVDFWAAWCGPCRSMNPSIENLARDFKVCKVNIDTNQELATRYGISSIPALLIFNRGKIVARHVGVTPKNTLRAEMESAGRS